MYALPIHPTAVHPATGKPLQAVFVSAKTGRVYWPILGGDGTDPAAPAAPAAPATDPTAPAAPVPAAPAAPTPPADPALAADAGKVEDLPAWAQKLIADTRKEAGDNRVAKTAAETRAQAVLDAIAKATGQAPEADPAKLTADLTAAQQTAAAAARELAVYKAASGIADPVRLLDRTSFTKAIAGIDPSDGAALKTAIEAAVAADQTLKAVQAAAASGMEITGGSGAPGQITEEQLKSMTAEQIVEAQEKGLLNALLNG